MRKLATAAAIGLLTALSLPAHAESCPVPEGASPALSSVEPSRRLSFVKGALDEAGEKSARWGAFWRVTFEVSAIAQFAMARGTRNDANRIDLVAGAAKSSVGFLFATLFRLPAERHAYVVDPPWEEGNVCKRLAAAESALELDAKFEQRARSVGMHALGISFNLAVGVATYLLHHRAWSTISATLIGGAVGEARVFTTPTVATDALVDYRAGRLSKDKVAITPIIVPQPGGGHFGLAVTF